jgi:hypothetical protein
MALCQFYTLYYPFHFLAASLRRFTTVKDSDLLSLKEQRTLAASLQHFTQFIARFIPLLRAYDILYRCSASAAKLMRERRERNPCRDSVRFYIP